MSGSVKSSVICDQQVITNLEKTGNACKHMQVYETKNKDGSTEYSISQKRNGFIELIYEMCMKMASSHNVTFNSISIDNFADKVNKGDVENSVTTMTIHNLIVDSHKADGVVVKDGEWRLLRPDGKPFKSCNVEIVLPEKSKSSDMKMYLEEVSPDAGVIVLVPVKGNESGTCQDRLNGAKGLYAHVDKTGRVDRIAIETDSKYARMSEEDLKDFFKTLNRTYGANLEGIEVNLTDDIHAAIETQRRGDRQMTAQQFAYEEHPGSRTYNPPQQT